MKNNVLHPDNKNGIYLYEYPVINGIKQYIQVRGTDRKNPLLLFIHGGPGASLAGLCHIMQAELEKKFTVVNWDQRNTCKTYFANKEKATEISKTGTIEDYINDIDDIVSYLHTVYEFDKLILMGFSWGSAIGAEYAKRHSENLSCYIGAGQFINYREGVMTVCDKMLRLVPENSPDEKKIRNIIDNFPQKPIWNNELTGLMRYYPVLASKYIAKHAKHLPLGKIFNSPFMNFKEKKSAIIPNTKMLEKSYETMLGYDFRNNLHFDVPVIFIYGDEENICPPEMLNACFDDINAPKKQIEIIPQASHCCFFDQPDLFINALCSFVNNIKQKGA